jgi:hypothetical protein
LAWRSRGYPDFLLTRLVVHAVVVLLPLATITTLVCAAVPRARRHYAPVALALALAATLGMALSQRSGDALEEQVDEAELVEEHTEQVNG